MIGEIWDFPIHKVCKLQRIWLKYHKGKNHRQASQAERGIYARMWKSRMKVLLIKPPIETLSVIGLSRRVPTGLMYLSHVLGRQGIEVRILDSFAWPQDSYIIPYPHLSKVQKKD